MSNMFSQTRSKFSETAVTFQKTIAIPEKRTCVQNDREKMAASKLIHTQMLYFCYHNGHVGSETISTDIFKLKCTAHIPVYLFANARDDVFLTRHYYVSTNLIKKNSCIDLNGELTTLLLSSRIYIFSPILLGRGRKPSGIHSLPVHML